MRRHRWRRVLNDGPGPDATRRVCRGCGWEIPGSMRAEELLDEFRVPRDCDEALVELVMEA